ncbi:hypothetical protein QJQ58_06005 [Paenibacillus dendritiformis]|uniref:hypothetical protein n=1 Tax=Paenibacillus dendritiformis TaxID=130049 RepID=UPI00248AE386|nr:hypothetical protein [Paenibacillus dendritiformis]WGU95819.1 hypothetical protein QJQ58_06005 [Paenibacillus dendritiformis]
MQKTGKAGKAKTKDMSATERMHREGAHGLEGSSCGWSLPPLQLRTPASGRWPPGYAVMRRRGMPASAGAFELGWYHDAFVPSGRVRFCVFPGLPAERRSGSVFRKPDGVSVLRCGRNG